MLIRQFIVSGAVLATLAHGQPTLAAPLQFAPTSPWTVEAAEESCALTRAFASGSDNMTIELRRYSPDPAVLISLGSSTLVPVHLTGTYRFLPSDRSAELTGSAATLTAGRRGIVFPASLSNHSGPASEDTEAPPADRTAAQLKRAAVVAALEVEGVFGETVSLPMDGPEMPMQALETCLDELVARWGFDALEQRALSYAAKPRDLRGWAAAIQENLPSSVIRPGFHHKARLRLTVDTKGRATGCVVQKQTQSYLFEEYVCQMSQARARFDPALDRNGRPVESYYTTEITAFES